MEEKQIITIEVPKELENLKLPAPELLQYYKERKDRTIYIDCDIEPSLIEASKQIMEYNLEDKGIPIEERKKIFIYIFSDGGDAAAAYSFIAICEASITPIVTVNMGLAMSAALLILLAGHERYCLKRSQALIHTGSGGIGGTYEQIQENAKMYRQTIEAMKDYIIEKSSIDNKLFNKNKSKDWYLTDKEQVKYGIVNGIVTTLYEIM